MARYWLRIGPLHALSQVLGWCSLIVAAGVSYHYARENINQRRKAQELAGARPPEKLDWRERIEQQEKQSAQTSTGGSTPVANASSQSSLRGGR
ncbi:hypothetical protein WOLCODRAFT_156001 [Wolfiporia cocos MD-104 SS10]|uniref:Uncharacterized protein n=1 Tax=Wolfiporia cocos (strain MD-104) TaxID=742152 RepID=A0A2H3J0T1_WOLCO|nr:hypothetical protein WOLCODRAFT_156001 [Wolfiporia cocos MD-104 SS10]